MELQILYRDKWLIAVDKPAGQLVHPSSDPQPEDEVTMKILRDQIGEQVRVAHRLDRPTSGVLLFTLDTEVEKRMRDAFTDRKVEKTYWAIIDGCPENDRWTCEEPLRTNPEAKSKPAKTQFRLLQRLADRSSLIEACPITGRYHQIRKHLLSAGYPIVGDYRYAGIDRSDELGKQLGTGTRMLLQAKQLRLSHPITNKTLHIEAPTDPMIEKALTLYDSKSS